MKGFVRNNQYLSLCGLNCKLCPMNLTGHCSGCGVDNQSCKIAKCSIEHGKIEYCFQCTSFPCDKYAHIDDFDSFITHHNQMNDMEKASQIGIPAYNAEQEEKRKLLDFLLSHYNDGRRKNLFCVAVNLLTIKEIENILQTVKSDKDFQSMGKKEQASVIEPLPVKRTVKKYKVFPVSSQVLLAVFYAARQSACFSIGVRTPRLR